MESVKRYKAMVNLPDGVLVADVYLAEECEEARRFTMRIEAALNPTAEAVSHDQ